MKKIFFFFLLLAGSFAASAQVRKASLQASGLTCSMCSKAVKTALDKVAFVEKVMVDIKSQEYNISFKEGAAIDFDALSAAVEDAGFSVAGLRVTVDMDASAIKKDEHLKIGDHYFHFMNAPKSAIEGPVTFNLVDKHFVSAKDHKKYSASSAKACVKTGKAASCCTTADVPADARIYHVLL